MLGDLVNVVAQYLREQTRDYIQEISAPALKLLALYGLQVRTKFQPPNKQLFQLGRMKQAQYINTEHRNTIIFWAVFQYFSAYRLSLPPEQGLLTSGYIILLSRVGERVAADMRKTLFASLLRYDASRCCDVTIRVQERPDVRRAVNSLWRSMLRFGTAMGGISVKQ